jgi:hypothetical protein
MVWYSTGEYGKAWFTADDMEHAQSLIDQVQEGEMSPEDLPDYIYKVKGGDGWESEGLEEQD